MDPQDVSGEEASTRERIRARFREWVDEALSHEDPPPGIAAEILAEAEGGESPVSPPTDLHSIQAAMLALAQEVALEGRAFHALKDDLARAGDLGPRVEALAGAFGHGMEEARAIADRSLEAAEARQREALREASRAAWRPVLDLLLDLRDRLDRGMETARARDHAPPRGWWDRLVGRSADRSDALNAIVEGYRLALLRLDDGLREIEVDEIVCEGRPFDPRRMKAVEAASAEGVPDGQVLAVHRRGYEWRGEVYRPAEVKVARAEAPREEEPDGRG